MTCPPAVLRLRITAADRRGLRLWLPVFLLWPLLPLVLVAAPAVVLAKTPRGKRRQALDGRLLVVGPRLLGALCSLRGLELNVRGQDEVVEIAVI